MQKWWCVWWCLTVGVSTKALGLVVMAPDGLAPCGVASLEAAGHELSLDDSRLKEASALIVRSRTRVTDGMLARAPKLRVVARAGVGVDNVDLDACRRRGVAVANTPTASTNAVAEMTIGLMLSVLRQLPAAFSATASDFDGFKQRAAGVEARGRTVGIVGYGPIGRRVADLAECLGMEVKVASRSRGTLRHVVAEADVVSLHVPLDDTTRSLVDADVLAMFRPNAVLLNLSRGGVVDENAVLAALDAGRLAAYATDVLNNEPPKTEADARLLCHPNVIATPHIGAATIEAQDRIAMGVALAVLAVLGADGGVDPNQLPKRGSGKSGVGRGSRKEDDFAFILPPLTPRLAGT